MVFTEHKDTTVMHDIKRHGCEKFGRNIRLGVELSAVSSSLGRGEASWAR